MNDYLLSQRMIVLDYSHDARFGGYVISAITTNPSAKMPYTEQYCSVPKDYNIKSGDLGSFDKKYAQNIDLIWRPMPKDEYTSEIYTVVGLVDIVKNREVVVYGKNIGEKRIDFRNFPRNIQVGHKLLLRSRKEAPDKYDVVHNITMARLKYEIDQGMYK